MNLYGLLIPQLLAGAAIVVIALRAVRQSRKETEAHEQRLAERQAEHKRYLAQLEQAAAHPDLPASTFVTEWAKPPVLRVRLDLADPNLLADVARMARDAERLIAGLSDYETTIGGRGLILTEAKAEPGQVLLTLTPKEATGASERVERVANALNAAFSSATPSRFPESNLGHLPSDVSAAHAVTLAT